MSILIKGLFGKDMPMPQEGYVDIRIHFKSGKLKRVTMQTGEDPFYATFDVEKLPPHGRLIDADGFKQDYNMGNECADCEQKQKGTLKSCEYDRIYSKMDFCQWLDNAETIIEAEEGSKE